MSAEEQLRGLGFTQHEATVYVFLVRHPLSTGYEVAKGTGLPRGNVYQVLETLAKREVVQALSAEPIRYVASPPKQLLARTRREIEMRCDAALDALSALEVPPQVELFFTLRDVDHVRARLLEMLERAAERVVVSLWAEDLDEYREPLRRAHRRGVTVVLNVFGETGESSPLPDGAQVYWHEPGDKTVGGHVIFAAVDNAEALAASVDPPASGVYTQNGTLVRLVEKLVRDESYLAEIFAQLGPELEARFGPHLVELRRRLLPEDQAQRLLTIVAFGRRGPEFRDGRAASELLEAGAAR